MSGNRERPKHFASLEAARGFAALLVTLHHTGNILAEPRFYGARPFGGHTGNFHVGVDFFFVLSGFLIAWMHWDYIGRPGRLTTYAKKRFLRIYPPYWGIAIPLTILYLAFPAAGIPSRHEPMNIAFSLLLLPYPAAPVLGVAWTLVHEVTFYMLFGLVIRLGRRALWILPAWALAITVAALTAQAPAYPLSFILSPYNLEFMMGVAAAALLRRHAIPYPHILASMAMASFLLLIWLVIDTATNALTSRLLFAIPAVLFILGAVEIERSRNLALPRIALLFGAASYAIYLVHPVALSAGMQVLTRFPGKTLPLDIAALLLAVAAIIAGSLYHLFAEARLIALVSRTVSRARHRTRPEETAV